MIELLYNITYSYTGTCENIIAKTEQRYILIKYILEIYL